MEEMYPADPWCQTIFSDKYDITKHKNYRLLADENEKNRYKVEKELNPQYTPKSEEEVEVIQVELSE